MDILPAEIHPTTETNPEDFKGYPLLSLTMFDGILDFADKLAIKLRETVPTPNPPTHILMTPHIFATYAAHHLTGLSLLHCL